MAWHTLPQLNKRTNQKHPEKDGRNRCYSQRPKAGVGKSQTTCQIWPTSLNKVLLKYSHSFAYILSMAVFVLQQHSWVVITETVWPQSLKYLPFGLLQKRFAASWSKDVRVSDLHKWRSLVPGRNQMDPEMTINHHKLNQAVAPVAAVMPDALILLVEVNMDSGTWYVAIDLINEFLYTPTRKEDLKQFALTWNRQQYASIASSQGCMNLPPHTQKRTSQRPAHSIFPWHWWYCDKLG